MSKMIVPIIDRCGGCRECEAVCSWVHNKGVVNPRRSRIKVVKDETEGVYIPFMCLQCEKPFCMDACPTGAIIEDYGTGVKVIREDVCIGCKICVIACPFGGVALDPDKRKVMKCDLCKDIGDPKCVEWCPRDALKLVDMDMEGTGSIKRGSGTGIEKLQTLLRNILIVE